MGNKFWPDADVEKLKELVAEGYSGGQIARMLSRIRRVYTRCAVLGKVDRMGLEMARKSSSEGIPRVTYCRGPRLRTQAAVVAPVAVTLPATVEQPETVARAATPPDSGLRHFSPGEALIALKPSDCRWPIGTVGDPDFHFCGQQQAWQSPYCETHSRTAHRKGEPHELR
jgi:hypothetical protein